MFRKQRNKADLLSKVVKPVKRAKMFARSTVSIDYQDGSRSLRYHDTDVYTVNPDQSVTLTSGGFRTQTTKERINAMISDLGLSVYQDRGSWYISNRGKTDPILFYDGITFDHSGNLISEVKELDKTRINKMKRKIAEYVKSIDSLDSIPFPSNGDCWYCCMKEVKTGKPLGDITKDLDHLMNHLEEKYIHGSIIFNALTEKGYRDPAFIMQCGIKDSIKRALRVYLTKRLLPDLATQ